MSIETKFEDLIRSGKLTVVDRLEVPARAERRRPLLGAYTRGAIGGWLREKLGTSETAWRHQSLALEKIDQGKNVVVSTGTASGKSLIFQLPAIREILESDGRTMVVYPLKALLSDQLARWQQLAGEFSLPQGSIAELHGDVRTEDRQATLATARVLLVTPDILQAWFMRQVSVPLFRAFMASLRYVVLDEAHIYESVFGSNVAYLIRRFLVARREAARNLKSVRDLQIIAATATILDPLGHMKRLTGWDFESVDERDDGSPTHGRTLVHIDGPDYGSAAESMLESIIGDIFEAHALDAFIAFHDSRQGVERITKNLDLQEVLPYRSGYERADRAKIEQGMRSGRLRGLVATSALELGIDVSGFTVGLNLGVPQSKKAFRQRLGRVGRTSHGVFAVLASRHAFSQFGQTFSDYYAGSVEPSYLYLENRFIQFAHARCLLDEAEQLKFETRQVPPGISWPTSFQAVYDVAKPGARRPKDFDYVAQLGATAPHINYALRQVGEANFKLKDGAKDIFDDIGSISLNQAIREAYPGALYLHLKRPMKVREWRSSSFDRSIRMEEARSEALTRPILKKSVNVGVSREEVIGGRVRTGASGLLAEVQLQVNETVLGFTVHSKSFLYRDLRSSDTRMARQQRDFQTTGIVIRITEPWFEGSQGSAPNTRARIAEAFADLLVREKSLAPADIDSAATNIAYYVQGVPRRATDTIVVYDSIYGGLRLTEPLFPDFAEFLDKLDRAAELAGPSARIDSETVSKLRRWFASLDEGMVIDGEHLTPPAGEWVVYAPGSVVSIRKNGVLIERELLEPRLEILGGTELLMYRYKGRDGSIALVPHDAIEPTGQDWKKVFWNPATGVITDPDELAEGTF